MTTALRGWDDEVPDHVRLVVVDDPGQRRWGRVRELADSGTAVLVTLTARAPLTIPEAPGGSAADDAGRSPAVVIDVDATGRATTISGPSRPPAPRHAESGAASAAGPSHADSPADSPAPSATPSAPTHESEAHA